MSIADIEAAYKEYYKSNWRNTITGLVILIVGYLLLRISNLSIESPYFWPGWLLLIIGGLLTLYARIAATLFFKKRLIDKKKKGIKGEKYG